MKQTVLYAAIALWLTACTSGPPPIPSPHDEYSAGLYMTVKVRASGLITYRADQVYFVRVCVDADATCDDCLIASTFAKEGRAYLLNAAPGEYRAVAVAFDSGLPGDHSVYFTYLTGALSNDTVVHVRPRTLVDAGNYLVTAEQGVCPDSAEPQQLKYAEQLEPGTPKCGLLKTMFHKLVSGDYLFVGGKAYAIGTQTFHYRATHHERLPPSAAPPSATSDLIGTGWEEYVAPIPH